MPRISPEFGGLLEAIAEVFSKPPRDANPTPGWWQAQVEQAVEAYLDGLDRKRPPRRPDRLGDPSKVRRKRG